MKKFGFTVALLLFVVALALAGCGKGGETSSPTTGGGGNTVSMTATNFTIHEITLHKGDTLHFDDPSSGGFHTICLGNDMQCDANEAGPSELKAPGFNVTAGQSKDVVFPDAGTFKITCSVHPNMNLTVTVQ